MSTKWLHREGPTWVEKEIITLEQYEEIVKLYPSPRPRFFTVLPIFASLLVALSLLSFIASNWDAIPQWGKLAVLLITLISFYSSGFRLYRKGHTGLGKGLLVLGLMTFGASMILIGQMFNLIAYDARLFVLWSLAGLALLYLYRDSIFYYATTILLLVGQLYSVFTFQSASWLLLAVTIFGLVKYTYRAESCLFGWIFAPLIGIQTVLLLTFKDDAWTWISLVAISLYVIGLWLGKRPMAKGFLVWPQAFSFAFSIFMVFAHQEYNHHASFLANPVSFMLLFWTLFLIGTWKSKLLPSQWVPMLLFIPFFYWPFADIAYLIVMFVYASSLIYLGDQENQRYKSNIGVFLFMLSSFIGYIQIAWAFLDKSLFFLIGGIILFSIHWILRRRRNWMREEDSSR